MANGEAPGWTLDIAGRRIGPGHACLVIAEVGVNHDGRLDLALRLVDAAADAGADAVKLQAFRTQDLVLAGVATAQYQRRAGIAEASQDEMLRQLEVDKSFLQSVMHHCDSRGVAFFATPYDDASLALLAELKVPTIKVASTDANNILFLERVAQLGLPVILSTGMCTLSEIRASYQCLRDNGVDQIAILKCTSSYPTLARDVNLRGMGTLRTVFPTAAIGFSDHTPGVGASPYAVALGANLIEKHVTLDRSLPGPDHAASIEPDELRRLVTEIRVVEEMLGSEVVAPTAEETVTRCALQKSLVTRGCLPAGRLASRETLTAKRTGGVGIPASRVLEVVGKRIRVALGDNEPVLWEHLDQ